MSKLVSVGFTSTIMLFSCVLTANATPAPPPTALQIRDARMTVSVEFVEARNGRVSKFSNLCTVSGKIPVYADNGSPASFRKGEIYGCKMRWKGQILDVSVAGAMAAVRGVSTFATADVSIVPPDAVPLCEQFCGPQALASSRGEIRVSGAPQSLKFTLSPDPVSVLNAKPTVWFNVDVTVTEYPVVQRP